MGLVTALQYGVLSFYNVAQVTLSSKLFPLFRQHLLHFRMACSFLLLGNLAGVQKGRNLFPPSLWVNCPIVHCIFFILVLHSLPLPVSTYFLSHTSYLTSLRNSNLLLPWYYTGFISICRAPFISVFICNPLRHPPSCIQYGENNNFLLHNSYLNVIMFSVLKKNVYKYLHFYLKNLKDKVFFKCAWQIHCKWDWGQLMWNFLWLKKYIRNVNKYSSEALRKKNWV